MKTFVSFFILLLTTGAALAGKQATITTGTTAQYFRGDLSLATFPTNVSSFTNDSAYVNQAGARSAISLTTTGTSGVSTYSSASGVLNIPNYSPSALSFANPARTLNSAFQISTTRNAFVSYAVNISATLSLTGGQVGTVHLDYADDSGFTTNVVTVVSTQNGNTGTLTIGLNTVQGSTASLSAIIPAAKYVRLRTVNTAGTPSFTYLNGQEVLL